MNGSEIKTIKKLLLIFSYTCAWGGCVSVPECRTLFNVSCSE